MTTSRLPELNNGIVTSWIPLTTQAALSPYPSSCNSAFRLETLSGTITNIVAYDPWYGQAIDTRYQGCLAGEQTQWWAQQNLPTTVFDLGPFACPTPYTTATTSVVASGTTMVACCPSDYQYQNQILPPLAGRQCLSALSSGQVITAKTGTIGSSNWTDTTATITATDVGVWGNQLNGFVFADAVVTAAGGPTQTGSNVVASTPAMTGTADSAHHSTSTSASASSSILNTTGGKVGIYVGVPLGAVILCCVIGIILLYRRRASRLDKQFAELEGRDMDISAPIIPPGPPPPRPPPPRPMPAALPTELWSPYEKECGGRHEMETWERPVEMWAGGIKN
ncbi:hypothetical protein LOCC1_G005551 [Lachnellula occidentalis]|uniref:Uncharacterized protein n=1 Tax=Lachnellula occidentalis TaxID=215460 RepID=A0A8H8RXW7_9HELO|nr:hypothetical protein LOCC1_G005551 [Lachnellula occidentalis]